MLKFRKSLKNQIKPKIEDGGKFLSSPLSSSLSFAMLRPSLSVEYYFFKRQSTVGSTFSEEKGRKTLRHHASRSLARERGMQGRQASITTWNKLNLRTLLPKSTTTRN